MSGRRKSAIKREKRHKRGRYQNLSESSLMPLRLLKRLIILRYPNTTSWFTHFKIVERRASTIDCLT